MKPHNPSGKSQRAEQMLTDKDRRNIHDLYHRHCVELEHLCERFGLEELVVLAILRQKRPADATQWQVRWDDSRGERRCEIFDTFQAARGYCAALSDVEWSRVERV